MIAESLYLESGESGSGTTLTCALQDWVDSASACKAIVWSDAGDASNTFTASTVDGNKVSTLTVGAGQ